ncbi:uncharacterized protein LOC132279642 [Cornus florida]|uniref:uncharacterized protein LOC132279642 n=1 Tax=Cornus florida TaxID=4283 RepID=UPI00289CC061|nr:uncharacterized protein LOC132279642 [Cornus florida]
MLLTQKSLISNITTFSSHLLLKNNGRKFGTTMAKKRDLPETSRIQQQPIFPLKVSNTIVARTAVAVLGLGFVDAGYSGDWSRIGAVSKEIEDLLKLAAFVVVPFCLFLIFSFSKEDEA